MDSPKSIPFSSYLHLLGKELRGVCLSRAELAMCVITSLLIGYSFNQAVSLFSEASRAAIQFKELAPGMNPYDGIFVPTFGALYLVSTFLFPFVAIRLIAPERQNGSMKLMLQLPVSSFCIILLKAIAGLAAWGLALCPAAAVIFIWHAMGGHLSWIELSNLVLGHFLYALVILGFSFFVAAISDSTSTAAILVLALTLGCWILDFAGGTTPGLLGEMSAYSLTASLRSFEQGVFSSQETLRLLCLGGLFLSWALFFVHTGERLLSRWRKAVIAALVAAIALFFVGARPFYSDVREDRRNSFRAEEEEALRKIPERLEIKVYLNPDDSRYRDFDRKVVSKLRRSIPKLSVELGPTGKNPLFGGGESPDYGRISFRYGGKTEDTFSNSAEDIVPLILRLAGVPAAHRSLFHYPGYPLVADLGNWGVLFSLGFPLLFFGLWVILYFPRGPFGWRKKNANEENAADGHARPSSHLWSGHR